MSDAVLKIDPALDTGNRRESIGSSQAVNLETRHGRRYVLPKSLKEHRRYKVELTLETTDGSSLEIHLQSEDAEVEQLGPSRCRYQRSLYGKRQGVVKDHLTIIIAQTSYQLSVLLPLEGDALDGHRYDMMLDDISHWLHSSLYRRAEHETVLDTREGEDDSLKATIETFYRLQDYVGDLRRALTRISRSPKEKINKKYQKTHETAPRQDAKTLRWNETRSGTPTSLTYRPNQTFDLYENRFILFVLDHLEQLLATVERSAVRTQDDLADARQDTLKLFEQDKREKKQLEDARQRHKRSQKIVEKVLRLRRQIQKMRQYPFLREVSYDPSQFRISFSLALTQDINYSRIFGLYRSLRSDSRLRPLSKISQFVEKISSLGVQRTWQVYEYWVFFATYDALVGCGFEEKKENGIVEMIDHQSLTPGLIEEDSVSLQNKESQVFHGGKSKYINLCYEKKFSKVFGESEAHDSKPDVTIEGYRTSESKSRRDTLQFRFVLDAKYKPLQKVDKSKIQQYQSRRAEGDISKGVGAFLVHPNPESEDLDKSALMDGHKKWGGHIPALPGSTGHLEHLVSLSLRDRLRRLDS